MKLKLKLFLVIEYIIFIFFFWYLYQFEKYLVPWHELFFFTLVLLILSNFSAFMETNTKITTQINLPLLIPAIIFLGP
ncbi:MAG: hypothetical protein AWU54_1168, partial [Candidatus Frackibacter sp. T328-2]